MSNRCWQTFRMNIKRLFLLGSTSETTVATFGAARLVRQANGRYELIGGSPADHFAAREWCSLFQHELVFSSRPIRESSEMAFAG